MNVTIYTGRTRRRWLLFTQYEYEGPVLMGRSQTPYNTEQWPRARWWSYRVPARLWINTVGLIR